MRERLVWLLALSLAAPAVAAAQEQKSVEPVVVTATKVETPSEQIGASISVVNGDDFQTYHYPTVDEALRNVPGVEIRRSGSTARRRASPSAGPTPTRCRCWSTGCE